jgi:type IV secretory pathway VirJ component
MNDFWLWLNNPLVTGAIVLMIGAVAYWIRSNADRKAIVEKVAEVDEKVVVVKKQTDGMAKALAQKSGEAGYAAGAADEKAKAPALADVIEQSVGRALDNKTNGT